MSIVIGFRMVFGRAGWLLEGGWELHEVDFDDLDTRLRNGLIQIGGIIAF